MHFRDARLEVVIFGAGVWDLCGRSMYCRLR